MPSSAIMINFWTQDLFLQPQLRNKQPSFPQTIPKIPIHCSHILQFSALSGSVGQVTDCFEYWLSIVHIYMYPVTLHHTCKDRISTIFFSCEGNSRLFNNTFAISILSCNHLFYNAQFSFMDSSLHSVSGLVSMLITCSIIYHFTGWKLYTHMQP